MPSLGFESTIPAFEREKILHALDRAATVVAKKLYVMYMFRNIFDLLL
jgi:hypothetical protein